MNVDDYLDFTQPLTTVTANDRCFTLISDVLQKLDLTAFTSHAKAGTNLSFYMDLLSIVAELHLIRSSLPKSRHNAKHTQRFKYLSNINGLVDAYIDIVEFIAYQINNLIKYKWITT